MSPGAGAVTGDKISLMDDLQHCNGNNTGTHISAKGKFSLLEIYILGTYISEKFRDNY